MLQILKFGGSSVGSAENVKRIRNIIASKRKKGKTVVVVSALGGTTDLLWQCGTLAASGQGCYRQTLQGIIDRHLAMVKELFPSHNQSSMLSYILQQFNEVEDICNGVFLLKEFSRRAKDRILSYGELVSSRILSDYLKAEGVENEWADARSLITTNNDYTKAAVDFERTGENFNSFFSASASDLLLIPGFIASDEKGDTTTLGRGGSDYTAAIAGAVMGASVVEIWTDVPGMMTADPRMVQNSKVIRQISYNEAMELSHFGAKVIYPPTIQPLMNRNIPVYIKNSFDPMLEGTLIHSSADRNGSIISGISSINKIALLSLEGSGMVGIPGFSRRFFEALAINNINVVMITQASSEHSICVGVEESTAEQARKLIDKAFRFEIEKEQLNPLLVESELSIVAVVGDNMKSHPGISGRMFAALGRNGINVRAIAQGSSERNISAVIATADIRKAVNVLHEAFFETTHKQINLFVAGTGNVGKKLLEQIEQQTKDLQQHLRLQVRVIGLINSRNMVFNEAGLDLKDWKQTLRQGETACLNRFIETMHKMNMRNSVFIDMSANEEVAMYYEKVFEKSISIIACNKTACSSAYGYYKNLKELAREHNVHFLFETNVGAGLPVIGTMNDLLRSGDRINRIEAVLSGTLNFVFNNYTGERSFADVVRQAQQEGYTEPDPRLDLSGKDVMRKILILAREAGEPLEMESINNIPFLPSSCMEGTVEHFYAELEKQEPHFRELYEKAKAAGTKLKFVAGYADGKASVGLKQISPSQDFYHLYGKDNIVLFYTTRYAEQPLVVKGAGAGAEVTASGVFADMIRTASS